MPAPLAGQDTRPVRATPVPGFLQGNVLRTDTRCFAQGFQQPALGQASNIDGEKSGSGSGRSRLGTTQQRKLAHGAATSGSKPWGPRVRDRHTGKPRTKPKRFRERVPTQGSTPKQRVSNRPKGG